MKAFSRTRSSRTFPELSLGNHAISRSIADLRHAAALLLLAAASLLVACGGGGGESGPVENGGSATLAWDASTSPGVIGYHIYYGTEPGIYFQLADAGNVTTYTVTGLDRAKTYYFVATAYDSSNGESFFSGEVSKVIP